MRINLEISKRPSPGKDPFSLFVYVNLSLAIHTSISFPNGIAILVQEVEHPP